MTARYIDTLNNQRLQRGQELANKLNQIIRIDERSYKVKSQSSDNEYDVILGESGWLCSCPDQMFRGVTCKHIHAVEISFELRKKVSSQIVIEPITINTCPQCKSDQIVKHGIRHNKYGDIQRYSCNNCYKRFTTNLGFEKMHATPQIITSAMQLYFTGESFRNVQKFLKLQGVNISHMAVYKWINKYVSLMEKYLDEIKPSVSGVWRTDELYLKVKGNTKYLFALMDDETRFWIAQQVADKKNTSDIQPLFKEGKERAGKKPNVLISDGAPNFHVAYKKELFTIKNPRTKHIKHIRFKGDRNNNKMERMNGEVRDREKVMRGLKKVDTPILTGYQIYHNYMRPHEGLNGKTPAEACGIKIEGDNKWKTLIENMSVGKSLT
jgi:putative transposase